MKMHRTSTLAAYLAWILALIAILMPPTFAAAGTEILVGARDALYGLIEDEPQTLALAELVDDEPGWEA
jgi:hypothetical protein